jgi:heptosyltransferase I
MPPQRICLVRLSALGDVCLAVPVLRTLRRAFPHAEITWVIGRAAYSLVHGLPGFHFVVLDKLAGGRGYWAAWRELRRHSFDALLAMQASFRAHLLYPAIRAPIRIGFDPSRSRDLHGLFVNRRIISRREHLLDSFFQFAESLGATERVLEWNLPVSKADMEFASEELGKRAECWLAVNPAASKPERTWSAERYARVCDQAMSRWNCGVVLTGGAAVWERGLAARIQARLQNRERIVNLVGRTTPKQLVAVLARARALLAPDTGPVHLATAVGTPVLGLYAVMTSRLSGPYQAGQWVIDRYDQALRRWKGRDPEEVPWGTRIHSRAAMDLIECDDVLDKLSQLFAGAIPRNRVNILGSK